MPRQSPGNYGRRTRQGGHSIPSTSVPAVPNYAVNSDAVNTIGGTTDTGLPSGNAAWSVDGWWLPTAFANSNLWGYGAQSGTGFLGLNIISATQLRFTTWSAVLATFTVAALNDAAWHYIGATWDGTSLSLYIDNAAAQTQTPGNLATVLAGANGLQLGGYANAQGNLYTGKVARPNVYGTKLSSARVAAHQSATTAAGAATAIAADSPLVSYKLDEASGNFTDSGSLGHNLTAGAGGLTYRVAGPFS